MDLYGINEIEIVENQLLINVSYGGGCEQHDFLVVSSNTQINDDGTIISGSENNFKFPVPATFNSN